MAPLSYLVSFGARAASIATLTWGVLLISIAVTVIVSVLLAIAIWHRKPLAGDTWRSAPRKRLGRRNAMVVDGRRHLNVRTRLDSGLDFDRPSEG
jgi:hypothetical protein